MTKRGAIYLVDASALINGWRRYYPPDVLPSLWERLAGLVGDGRLKAPEEVRLEIARIEDDLYAWVSSHNEMFIPPVERIQKRVSAIINAFPSFMPERSPDGIWADPYVIAIAQEENGIVVTEERLADRNARRPKIPNICVALGIEYIGLLDLMRRERWSF
jgi:hypothetical protein